MSGASYKRERARKKRVSRDNGRFTAVVLLLVGLGFALADQVVAPSVEIDPQVYLLVIGGAVGAIAPNIIKKRNGK